MADISLLGATYPGVPAVELPKAGGGVATFHEEVGTKTITENGSGIDVSGYAAVDVSVQGGGGGFIMTETPDAHGGTVLEITGIEYVAEQGSATPDETVQTVTPSAGKLFDEVEVGAIPSNYVGSGVTRKAAATYTPSSSAQTIAAGQYLDGAQTIDPIPSQYIVPSGSETKTANGTYDVTNLAQLIVNVATGKAVQIAPGFGRVNTTTYTAVTGQSITVGKTGTYDVYWVGYRSSTSGTNGSQLYVGSSAHSSGAQTTFDATYTNWQIVHLSNVSLTKDQVVTVRARARGSSYYMYVANLTIIEA